MKQGTITGKVVLQTWAAGSKSEHEAYCLVTETGAVHKLRRDFQTNPFELDGFWEQYRDKNITVSGDVLNNGTVITGTEITPLDK